MTDTDPLIGLFGPLAPYVKALAGAGGFGAILLALSRLLPSGDRRLDEARDLRVADAARIEQLSNEREQLAEEVRTLRHDLVEATEKYLDMREQKVQAVSMVAIITAELEQVRSNLNLPRGATPEQVAAMSAQSVDTEQIRKLTQETERRSHGRAPR